MTIATFELTIHRQADGCYAAEARFTTPQHDERVPSLLTTLDLDALRGIDLPDGYGRALTEQLFAAPVLRVAWLQACAVALPAGPLALRLRLDARDPALHAIRWETLRDPVDDQPFALSQRIRLARTLDGGAFAALPLAPRPTALRALVAVAAAEDLADYGLAAIDADGELVRARAALGDIPATVLGDVGGAAGRATLEAIQAALNDGPQIVILIAHGALRDGQPIIYLEDRTGRAVLTPGQLLVDGLARLAQRPLLLVLVSCGSAGDDYAALSALGPRLAQIGLPAVLAFQGDIAMAATKRLLPVLLREARKDGRIDRALAAARATLGVGGPWWQPTLFLRGDGRLWREAGDQKAQPLVHAPKTASVALYLAAHPQLNGKAHGHPNEQVIDWAVPFQAGDPAPSVWAADLLPALQQLKTSLKGQHSTQIVLRADARNSVGLAFGAVFCQRASFQIYYRDNRGDLWRTDEPTTATLPLAQRETILDIAGSDLVLELAITQPAQSVTVLVDAWLRGRAPQPATVANYDRRAWRDLLNRYFNESELQDLCFELQIDYESLPGGTKSAKARELVAYAERHERNRDLLAASRHLRPHVDWSKVSAASVAEPTSVTPIRKRIVLTPDPDVEQLTPAQGAAIAQRICGVVMKEGLPGGTVHIFGALPLGIALLVGWDLRAERTIQCYDLDKKVYKPTCLITT